MTECERIISDGLIPESFLREEVRNDFLVDVNRKKLWMILLDLLLQVDRVCKKHNIQYFLDGGTLLGAIRHKGFIPWDDDLDIMMLRPEYEKFLTLKDEFQEPYFLQTPYTDPGYYGSFAKLRNSNTTGMSLRFAYQHFNFGITLDIFAYDNNDDSAESRKRYETLNNLHIQNSTAMKKSNLHLSERDKQRVRELNDADPLKRYEEIQKLCRTFENQNTKYVSDLMATAYGFDRDLFFKEDFSKAIEWEFEGFKFPVPIGYDRMLKILYGDYMEFPPIEERGKAARHDDVFVDPDNSYKNYERFLKFLADYENS